MSCSMNWIKGTDMIARIRCMLRHTKRYFKHGYWPYYNTCTDCGLDWRLGEPCPPFDGPVYNDALKEYNRKRHEVAYKIVFDAKKGN